MRHKLIKFSTILFFFQINLSFFCRIVGKLKHIRQKLISVIPCYAFGAKITPTPLL